MTKSFCLNATLTKIMLRPVLRMGWKLFTTTLELFRAPHARTTIFLTENRRHTCFVPGFVRVHTLD